MAELHIPIIDAHLHLWNPDRFAMHWLAGDPVLQQTYELAEYDQASREADVEGFVFVETGVEGQYAFLEAQWIARVAETEPRLKAIVAAAPIEHGQHARYYLEQLVAASPLIKGVRRLLQSETDPSFCLRPDFIAGVQLLAELNLSFDICITHEQLPAIIELVKRCSTTRFILDHAAKPAIKSGEIKQWANYIHTLAAQPNIACKISGLVTEADHHNWKPGTLQPYIAEVLAAFGEDRVLFGSDWPVMLLASNYTEWIQTLDQLTRQLSHEARRKLYSGNSTVWYEL